MSYRFIPISSQKGVLFLRHPVVFCNIVVILCIVVLYFVGGRGW